MNRVHRYGFIALVVMLVLSINIPQLEAQTFSSGSNGSDGALNLTTPGTILFDPASFATPLDPDGDGVYHFTTINIAAGVTVRLRANILGTIPVVWLATGDVKIDGILDLSGENGHDAGSPVIPAIAGAGGFGGGIGGTPTSASTPGNGPGGTVRVTGSHPGGAGHALPGVATGASPGGKAYGNNFLLPLIGGSGGGGGDTNGNVVGSGGGSGGGAVLIASSTGITLTGNILANGGSGGSIRLVSNQIGGVGLLSVQGGSSVASGSEGRIRIEAFLHNFTGTTTPFARFVTPGIVFPPVGSPSVRVTQVAGTSVPAKTRASFNPADLTINESGAVSFQIEAHNIPTGTVINLRMWSETGGTVNFTSQPLAGTLATSTATATTTIPHGFSRFTVEATWTP